MSAPLKASGDGVARRVLGRDRQVLGWTDRLRTTLVFCHGNPGRPPSGGPTPRPSAASSRSTSGTCRATGSHRRSPEHKVSLDVQGELLGDLLDHWGPEAPQVVARTTAVRWRSGRTCCMVTGSRRSPWSTWSPWHRGDRTTSAWCATTRTSSRRCPASCTKAPCAPTSPGQPRRGHHGTAGRLGRPVAGPRRAGGLLPADRAGGPGIHRRDRIPLPEAGPACSRHRALRTPGSRRTMPSGSPNSSRRLGSS